jgi:hypothetical protein
MRAQGLNRGARFRGIVRNDDALAGGQTIGFDDNRKRKFAQSRRRVVEGIRAHEASGGNPHAAHEFLGVDFARFELGLFLRRTEDAQGPFAEPVDNPFGERRFRADDGELRADGFSGGSVVANVMVGVD